MVSGTHVHFGCRGDQSPSGQQSKQWEPQTAVSSLLGFISIASPLYCLDRISFYTFHPPQDDTCGFRKASTTDVTSLMAEGSLLIGLVDCLAMAWLGASVVF